MGNLLLSSPFAFCVWFNQFFLRNFLRVTCSFTIPCVERKKNEIAIIKSGVCVCARKQQKITWLDLNCFYGLLNKSEWEWKWKHVWEKMGKTSHSGSQENGFIGNIETKLKPMYSMEFDSTVKCDYFPWHYKRETWKLSIPTALPFPWEAKDNLSFHVMTSEYHHGQLKWSEVNILTKKIYQSRHLIEQTDMKEKKYFQKSTSLQRKYINPDI